MSIIEDGFFAPIPENRESALKARIAELERELAEAVAHERKLVCSECGGTSCLGIRDTGGFVCPDTYHHRQLITRAEHEHRNHSDPSDRSSDQQREAEEILSEIRQNMKP